METTVICVDNSEWTRNGDYSPCRFQAQVDAVNLLAGAKTEANAENRVGILLMGGSHPRITTTPTQDLGKILNVMQSVDIEGESILGRSLQIAQLALKHRQNKLHRQRIVMFVASPISEDKDSLVKLAKRLKKNNVAVDIVSYAAVEENEDKLLAFQEAINSGDNSHLVSVPAGTILADNLYNTPLFRGEGSIQVLGTEGVPEGMEGMAVDPNLDPELALALRVSLEEERARQQAAAGPSETAGTSADTPAPAPAGDTIMNENPVTPVNPITSAAAEPDSAEPMEMDEDALLQQALAMSMAEEMAAEDAEVEDGEEEEDDSAGGEAADVSMFDEYDEELQNAIRMSMQETQPGEEKAEDKPKEGDGGSNNQ